MIEADGMHVSREFERNVRPASLLARAKADTRDRFVAAFGDTQLLLVCLDDRGAELAAGLEEADTATIQPPDGAAVIGLITLPGSRAEAAREAARRRPPPDTFDHIGLQALFSRGPYFVLPLRRRPKMSDEPSERISIGRGRESDVVLRHPSVSKMHAWVEADVDGTFFVTDARSKNATKVNGVIVDPTALVAVRPGDEIRFGLVQATLCGAGTFWDAVAGSQ
jgi:hypothetical protein